MPEGKRGVALQVAHDRYRPGAVADKFTAANKRTTLFCQIETAEGVENADAMAAIDGVDCLWVGHFDLSVLARHSRASSTTRIQERDRATSPRPKKHNKALGRLVPDVEQGVDVYKQGFDFICYSGDVWVLHNALAEAVDASLRARHARRRGGEMMAETVPRRALRRLPQGGRHRRPIPISTLRRCRTRRASRCAFLEPRIRITRRAA